MDTSQESSIDSDPNITLSGTSEAIDEIDVEQRVIDLQSKVIELQTELEKTKAELEKANEFRDRVKPITELFRNPLVTTDKNGYYPINGQMTKFMMLLLW